ncbi:hypothetical protein [Chryseobacterium indologenes]|uniref:Uncharacterized protein n=1 Tax=Chryseobacterium indologenes TaxID=253 RepID=A0A0N0ZVF0_CHRID|nr:hypothetical protein [Chryseobacterium indologenes]KPE49967.1 hypothetical protein AOB46_17430 [Chryseobacterium indologenes]
MKTIRYSPLGRNVFLASFLTGTFIFISFLVTRSDFLVTLGFYHVVTAAVVNLIVLLYELIQFLTSVSDHKASGNSILLMLLNIPVTALYLLIVFNI